MNSTPFKGSDLPGPGTILLGLASLVTMATGIHDILKGRHLSETVHYTLFAVSIGSGFWAVELLIRWAERATRVPKPPVDFE